MPPADPGARAPETGRQQAGVPPPGGKRAAPSHHTRRFLLTCAAVLLLVGSYEVLERAGLLGLQPETLLVVRSVLIAVVAAALIGWLILRNPPPPGENDPAEPTGDAVSESEARRNARLAEWFIRMRWLAVVVAALLVLFTVQGVAWLPRSVWWPLVSTIAILAALNALYAAQLHSVRATARLLPVQTYLDLVILTVLLHFAGGIENPLATLMLIHVIIAGIILPRRRCYVVATVASALFAALAVAEWAHLLDHYTFRVFPHHLEGGASAHAAHDASYAFSAVTVQTVILFLTAYFSTTVTDRLRSHERRLTVYADRLHAQSQLLEKALETTDTGLCVCDRELQPILSNERWRSWFGDSPASSPAVGAQDVGSGPGLSTLDDGEVRITEVALDGPGRGTLPRRVIELTTAPLMDKDAIVTHVVHLAHEITEQKRLQAGMIQAEKLAAVGEIAGKVAHEVNNPIAIISAKARLLLADPQESISSKVSRELTTITDLADRVARVAQGLLSYCRPAAGPPALLDIRVPIRKALAVIETPAATAGVRIVRHLPDTLPNVYANAAELEQVFLNLFLNSLDAMPHGGTLSVTAAVEDAGPEPGERGLLVLVEDTGCGIPEDILDHVFEPFVTTKESGRGTGLGLSICLGLVRSNGGRIELESKPGQGTIVRLRLAARGPITGKYYDG